MDPVAEPPLLITRDPTLRDAVSRLCAAASVRPVCVDDPAEVRQAWSRAPAVMVGLDAIEQLAGWSLGRRRDVALLLSGVDASVGWRAAMTAGADQAMSLPDDEGRLIQWLHDVGQRARPGGLVLAVMGAHGGAGASTYAVCLSKALNDVGSRPVLIDADAWSGGLELVVGCESVAGVRWADLTTEAGRVTGPALHEALPRSDGIAVLSTAPGDQGDLTPSLVRDVVAAAATAFDAVLLDLPRGTDAWLIEVGPLVDVLLVVATTSVRSASAAARTVARAAPWVPDIRLVGRRRRGEGVALSQLASSAGVPLAASLTTSRLTSRAVAEGIGPVLSTGDRRRARALALALSRLQEHDSR